LNLDLLDTFLDLLETRNFNRTAERLGTTQSTISARVRSLEKSVGATLFQRGRAGAIPTASGVRFEQHARALKAAWTHARRDAGSLEAFAGSLRISAQFSLMRRLLVDWASDLRRTGDRVALHIEADYSAQIAADLAAGLVDIGVLFAPRYLPDLTIEELGSERFVMVSTLATRMAEIAPAGYIHPGYTAFFDRVHAELHPGMARPSITVGYEELALALLRRLGGTTYLPVDLLAGAAGEGEIRLVEDAPEILQPVYVAVQRRRSHDPQIMRALRSLKSVAGRHFAADARVP
jgi:LysR family transcriptional regulator, flagellar master operon regulator